MAAELGVEAKLQHYIRGNKYLELNSGAIDASGTGYLKLRGRDEVKPRDKVSFSVAYLDNAQCVVAKTAAAAELKSAADLAGKSCAVEAGSAGETYAASVTDEAKIIKKTSQKDTFLELASGNVDFIVVDVLLANEIVGKGDYAGVLAKASVEIEKEEYAVGCRSGSDFTAKINALWKPRQNGASLPPCDKYGEYDAKLFPPLPPN